MSNSYWIADHEGVKALVEGEDARDWWTKVHGWTVTGDPTAKARVWLQHAQHGGRQIFPALSVPGWAVRGWLPSDPPVPEDKATAHWALEVPAADPEPTVSTSSKPAAKAAGGTSKE